MKEMLAQLLKNTYTKKDLIDQIRLITTEIKTKGPKPYGSKPPVDESNLITPDIIKELPIENLPVVVITLAISPPKEEIRRLGQWFRQQVDPQILLDIRQDPKIIGGCQIIWQGVEGDFSLRKKFK